MRGCSCFFYNRKPVVYLMGGCNWSWHVTQYFSITCQIHCVYAIHDCKCSLKRSPIQWGMDNCSYFFKIKKQCTLKKNCSLRLNVVTFTEFFFRKNYSWSQPFLKSCYFTRIVVHLAVIIAVNHLSIHKLKGWDPENIYSFKFNIRNTSVWNMPKVNNKYNRKLFWCLYC